MAGRLEIRGELHLTLETVAECYQVEATWLREVYDLGLLGPGAPAGGSVAIAARQLDRVARIMRLHFHDGVSLAGLALLLGIDEEAS